jgi:uncharacterized protein CbrC (UPF0167 family)
MVEFRFFRDFERNAKFTDEPCAPGHQPPFFDGTYFDGEYEDEGVCLDCLVSGRKVVEIESYLRSKIEKYAQTQSDAARIIQELERTPPVPWIQYNDWPFCCHEPMQYRGEYSSESHFEDSELDEFAQNLWGMVDEQGKLQAGDFASLQGSIEDGMTACFIFKCLHCGRFAAVCQSY